LLKGLPAVLVLTDATPLSPSDRLSIANWVDKGGLLLRFAGPKLAAAEPTDRDPLLPTELRTGGRSLSGAMSWTEPAHLAPFPEDSPFSGLDIPSDVTVSRQILAEPSMDLDRKVWARLADGTPLITADKREAGTVVLVHTSADPDWSSLSLSGLFPQMLRRIVAYSAGISRAPDHGALEPYRVLDGFARLRPPRGEAAAITAERFDSTTPDPRHPPGYYGETDSRRALNLTQTVTTVSGLDSLPGAIEREDYDQRPGEVSLARWLMGAALALATLDTLVALWLVAQGPARGSARGDRDDAGPGGMRDGTLRDGSGRRSTGRSGDVRRGCAHRGGGGAGHAGLCRDWRRRDRQDQQGRPARVGPPADPAHRD
jgi:hypothetical protein